MTRIGTAGWSIPAAVRDRFQDGGSILERYAQVFDAVEVNSSFYRPHKPQTYARWAASTPDDFRFAVKLPKTITHERRLVDVAEPLDRFLAETATLGVKRGPILIQLPPSLAFDAKIAPRFFNCVRERCDGDLVCEPRHASWFTAEADALLVQSRGARVAADPALSEVAAEPGGVDRPPLLALARVAAALHLRLWPRATGRPCRAIGSRRLGDFRQHHVRRSGAGRPAVASASALKSTSFDTWL